MNKCLRFEMIDICCWTLTNSKTGDVPFLTHSWQKYFLLSSIHFCSAIFDTFLLCEDISLSFISFWDSGQVCAVKMAWYQPRRFLCCYIWTKTNFENIWPLYACGGGGGEGERCWVIWKDKHPANDISVLHAFILFGQNDYSFNSFTDWEG